MASRRRVDDSEEPEEATALDLRPSSRSARPADPPPPARKPPVPAPSRRVVDSDSSEDDGEATEFLAVRPASKVNSPAKQSQLPSAPSPRSLPSAPHTPAPVVDQPRGNRRAVPLEGRSSSSSQSQSMEGTAPLSTLPPAAPSPRPLPSRGADSIVDHTSTASIPRVTRIHVVNKGLSTAADDGVHGAIRADDDDVERTLPPESAPRAPAPPPAPVQRPKKPATMVDIVDDETQAPEGFDPDGTQAPDRFIDDEPAAPALSATGPMPLPLPPAPTSPAPTSPQAARTPIHDVETAPLPTQQAPLPAPKPRPKLPVQPQALVQNDGVLVVEAPADASITVNGVDRGRGVVRVSELDREARHAVRIHAPGFQPWSGSVSLQGKAAAKIKPTLKPRVR